MINNSSNIIGGADGPTTIFLAGRLGSSFIILFMLLIVVLAIAGMVWFFKRKK